MTWSIPISSFSALVTGETSYFNPRSHIWEWLTGFMHGKHRMGKSCLLAWCNVTAICWNLLFLVHAIYLLSLDLVANAFTVAPSTELISCYFNLSSAFILLCRDLNIGRLSDNASLHDFCSCFLCDHMSELVCRAKEEPASMLPGRSGSAAVANGLPLKQLTFVTTASCRDHWGVVR
jgi:hypothetical protein